MRGAPQRIGGGHFSDEGADVGVDGRATHGAPAGELGPELAETAQSREINHLPAGRGFGEGQAVIAPRGRPRQGGGARRRRPERGGQPV
jgi:hypothetical protein